MLVDRVTEVWQALSQRAELVATASPLAIERATSAASRRDVAAIAAPIPIAAV